MVDREAIFPGLQGAAHQITSLATGEYNCIASAVGDVGRWWWPDPLGKRYWPAGVIRAETVSAFQEAFESLGFVNCADEHLEPDFEKIALFADDKGPQHAARQLPSGRWTSKLGELEDIEHAPDDLEGVEYGKIVTVMRRQIPTP